MSQAKRLAAGVPMADSNGKVTTISVGDKSGELVKWCDFPTYSALAELGYEIDVKNSKTYFVALLKWAADKLNGKEGIFIGKMTPNSRGPGILYVYEGAKNADTGLPINCVCQFSNLDGSVLNFGTTKDGFFCKRHIGTDY